MLLSPFFELIVHVFRLRTRPGDGEGESKLLFLTAAPYCLRYFGELGNLGHNYPILWKSPKRNYKAAFHSSLWTIHEFVFENQNSLTLGLTPFGVSDPLNLYPWKQAVDSLCRNSLQPKVLSHSQACQEKKDVGTPPPPPQPLRKGETDLARPFC